VSKKRFSGKVVWVTGASSGIGEALAYAFHQEGAKLILSARRESELERVKQACGGGDDILVLPADLERLEEIPAHAERALAVFGQVDILINNAGITQRSLVKDTTVEVDERLMRLDYLAPVALTKAVLPSMLKRGKGHVVAISSVAGFVGTPLRSSYAAAKHALRGFYDSMRAEVWEQGLRVSLVYPGYVQTEITMHAVTGDGSKFGVMGEGQSVGISAPECAAKILDGLAKEKEEIFVGGKELGAVYLKRFAPGLVSRMVRKVKVT
jgi:short-subunit dehydrogenase